jgi:dsRNA-specific ribonuclease
VSGVGVGPSKQLAAQRAAAAALAQTHAWVNLAIEPQSDQ